MTTASEIASQKTNEELDQYWSITRGHLEGCACNSCDQMLRSIRAARAAGIECSCRDENGIYCELHGITLCNG
jgi:hypothetical protein